MAAGHQEDTPAGPRAGLRLLLMLPLLLLVGLLAATRPAAAQFTRFQNFSEEQGLGNLAVTALAQDGPGYILIGTEGGLFRYDGMTFSSDFTGLPRDSITQVVLDRFDRVWVMTKDSGLFLGSGTDFHRITLDRPWTTSWNSHRLALTGDAAFLVSGTTLLVAPLRPDGPVAFAPLPPGEAARTLALHPPHLVVPDAAGGVLLGCGEGLCRLFGGRITAFGADDGLPADAWLTAMRAPDGTLWMRSLRQLAWKRPDATSFTVTPIPGLHQDVFHDRAIGRDLLPEADHRILTEGDTGLLVWTGAAWQGFGPHEDGIPTAPLIALFQGRDHSLWLGSEGYGLFRDQQRNVWEHWTMQDGLPSNQVWGLWRQAGGQLRATTNRGSVALRSDGRPARLAGTLYALAGTRENRLWLFPNIGLPVRLEADGRGMDMVALFDRPNVQVHAAKVDRSDALWLATESDVFLLPDADAVPVVDKARVVLHQSGCQLLRNGEGTLFAACRDGLFRHGTGADLTPVAVPDLFPGTVLAAAFAHDGTFWISMSPGGLHRFAVTPAGFSPLPAPVLPGPPDVDVVSMLCDRRGWMWFGSDHGAFRFDGRSWRHFDSSDGPISNDLDQNSIFEDKDGSIWFGTSHGLSHLIDPDHLLPTPPLHPAITGVWIGHRALPLGRTVKVDWGSQPLVIHAVDLNFTRGRGIAFRYRLRGVDTGWNETKAQEIRYAGLPPGQMRFEIQAVDTLRGDVSAPVGFAIVVRAPWWRQWWFYGLCALLLLGVVYGIWRIRTGLLRRQQQQLAALVDTRTAEIGEARDLLEQQAGELRRLALSDALTGLANRHAIMGVLDAAIAAARSGEPGLAVLLCDIDHFKSINDRFGHLAGDSVLAAFGRRLNEVITPPETVGRYGGEEFLVVLRGRAEALTARVPVLLGSVADTPFPIGDTEHTLTYSGGLAFLRADDTPTSLLARADAALYRAKAEGRNRINREQDPSGETPMAEVPEAVLERDLHAALHRDEFALYFQPIVDLVDNRIIAYEALLRWFSPSRGMVSPATFVPLAERCGLIAAIDRWVVREACRQAAGWPDGITVSINLSASHFHQPGLARTVARELRASGLPGRRLEVEVTETAMLVDVSGTAAVLAELRALGVTVALDDFGTGYSSLSFLRTLPFDRIKIDRSFVQDLGTRPEAATIIGGMIGLCQGLGAAVTVEGIETPDQLALLRRAGCREGQGYWLGRPIPADAVKRPVAVAAAACALLPAGT